MSEKWDYINDTCQLDTENDEINRLEEIDREAEDEDDDAGDADFEE